MSNLGKAIRQVRFNLKDTEKIHLIVETMTGERINLKMINCSLTGIGTLAEFTNDKPTGFEIDSIIPASKIICNEQEISLGRLIIRRIEPQGNKTYIAFSTMDIKVPVDGILTHYTVGELDVQKNPFAYELSPDKFNMASFEMDSVSNADLFYRTDQFDIYYKEFEKSLKFQYSNTRLASQGERIKLDKKRKNNRNDYLVMGSNDYLGLASDPTVCEAARKAVLDYGFGSTGSPVTTGSTDIHDELSSYLSKLFKKESVLLFNSGYAANLGTIAGLTRVEDLIIADHNSHASIHDGISLSKATSRYFKHNDVGHLEKLLQEHRASHFGSLIITEGVFSMDGDIPPLEDIIKIARQYNSRIFLDEAHSFGVIGPTGLGCWELCADKEDKIDIIMGTFSKICGGIGGFIAGPKSVTHWLKCYARSHMFSVSIPPSTAAAALTALKVFADKPQLLQNLRSNIKHFITGLRSLGFPINANHQSAVIPLIIGDEIKLGQMNAVFRENGIYVIPIIYPAVNRTNARFRFTMMATHTISDLDFALHIIERAMKEANFSFTEKPLKLAA